MDERAQRQREKDLYPAIQKLMETRGYAVISQFKTFSPLTEGRRVLDLLGFRWTEDGDLDAWAVEAKQGALPAHTLTALGQAIEYQLYVPRVSVAAEVRREDLAFAENPLRQLGLGYIHATPITATEIITPALSPRCYQNEFNQVIRHAGVLCLLGREWWKQEERREHHSGGEGPTGKVGYPFYAIHNNDPVQYMLETTGEAKKVRLTIWIEAKPVLTRIYAQIEAGCLAELVEKSEARAGISFFKRDNFGRLGKSLDDRLLGPNQRTIATELDHARARLKERQLIPVVCVALELWAWDAMPRCAEAKKAIAQAVERLEPIRLYLAAMAK